MKEIELKILEVNSVELEKKLKKLGAEFHGEIFLDEKKYDTPDLKFKHEGSLLRVRKNGDKTTLTLKINRGHSTDIADIRDEYEVMVSDIGIMHDILSNFGFEVADEAQKYRKIYELDGVEIVIDRYIGRYSFIPELIEIEGPTEKAVLDMAIKLGYKKEDCRPFTFLQLRSHYNPDLK